MIMSNIIEVSIIVSIYVFVPESSGLRAVEESQVKPCVFAFSLETPVKIFTVQNGWASKLNAVYKVLFLHKSINPPWFSNSC